MSNRSICRIRLRVMPRNRAFTLLEIIVAIVVVAILASVSIQSFDSFKRKAEKARCMANLRNLHNGFDGYMLEHNQWPQMTAEAVDFDEVAFYGWWVKALEPYGVGQDSWICPSDKVVKEKGISAGGFAAGSYVPTLFDEHHFTPFRWNQPWLMERGAFHNKKGHMLMPDGSIQESAAPMIGN